MFQANQVVTLHMSCSTSVFFPQSLLGSGYTDLLDAFQMYNQQAQLPGMFFLQISVCLALFHLILVSTQISSLQENFPDSSLEQYPSSSDHSHHLPCLVFFITIITSLHDYTYIFVLFVSNWLCLPHQQASSIPGWSFLFSRCGLCAYI